MRVTYYNTADSTPKAATALDALAGADDDRVLKKIIVGKPAASGDIVIYDITNAVMGATTNVAFRLTFPATLATGVNQENIDLTAAGGKPGGSNGILLKGGGSFTTSAAMQVSFLWDNPDDD